MSELAPPEETCREPRREWPFWALSMGMHLLCVGVLSSYQPSFERGQDPVLEVSWVELADAPSAPPAVSDLTPGSSVDAPQVVASTSLLPREVLPRVPHELDPQRGSPEAASSTASSQVSTGAMSGGPRLFPGDGKGNLWPQWSGEGGVAGSSEGGTSATGGDTGGSSGLRSPIEVAAEIREDARRTIAEDRVARGLVSKETQAIVTQLEQNWKVELSEVHSWPVRPETRTEHFVPEGAEGEFHGGSCTYQRYSLAKVRLALDQDGTVVATTFLRSSGSRRLDREVIDLINRSNPLPAPSSHDLDAEGVAVSVWDVGVRDYSKSSCIYLRGPRLIKDIVVLESSYGSLP